MVQSIVATIKVKPGQEAEFQAVAEKSHVSQVRNEIPTGAYGVFNLRSSYEWRFIRVDVGIGNLFNHLYANPLGGAYVGQGPSMSTTGIPCSPARTWPPSVNA